MAEAIVNRLKGIIADRLDVNIGYDEIDENVSLFEDGLGLDSIAIVDLIVSIEKDFSLSIDDQELNVELFKSLGTLARFIEGKLDGRSATAN
jgi:acyl carrier protein